jgi:hypothetical protein
MRELSGAETEKEKVAVTVEKQCQQQLRDLWKSAFSASGIGRQALYQKTVARL